VEKAGPLKVRLKWHYSQTLHRNLQAVVLMNEGDPCFYLFQFAHLKLSEAFEFLFFNMFHH
jgi:hypothetical protein